MKIAAAEKTVQTLNLTQKLMAGACLAVVTLFSLPASAAMQDHVLYERVATLDLSDHHVQKIEVGQATRYELTLTDFAFPDEISHLGVQLISATGVLQSLVLEKNAEEVISQTVWGTSLSASKKRKLAPVTHSWGEDFKQTSVSGFIDAGTYYIAMFADFEGSWYPQHGMYSAQMIATPIPASILFFASGLSAFFYMRRRGVAKPVLAA